MFHITINTSPTQRCCCDSCISCCASFISCCESKLLVKYMFIMTGSGYLHLHSTRNPFTSNCPFIQVFLTKQRRLVNPNCGRGLWSQKLEVFSETRSFIYKTQNCVPEWSNSPVNSRTPSFFLVQLSLKRTRANSTVLILQLLLLQCPITIHTAR